MTRIIPPIHNSDKVPTSAPKWMDVNAIMQASEKELKAGNDLIQKLASKEQERTILSYACENCSKVFNSTHSALKAQATLADNQQKSVEYTCPSCGGGLKPYQTIAKMDLDHNTTYAEQTEKRSSLDKEASGTYNTFTDMHYVLRAIQELTKFASKNGMTMPRARYIKSEHVKVTGQDYPTLNNIQCELEWIYGRKQKARVMAAIAVDEAGKFVYPKIFKTADGTQHPFEKEYILAMEKLPNFNKMMMRGPKKTDIPTFRKPDITRFRAFGSMNEDEMQKGYKKHVEKKKAKGKEPKSFEDWKKKKMDKDASLKQSFQQPQQPMAQTPTQPQQNVQYQSGQQIINPVDGKVYNVKTPSSGTGMVVTDPQTNQDAMIPQNQIQNVKPAVRTTSHLKTAEEMANDLMDNFLHKEIDEEKDEIQQHLEMMHGDVNEIQDAENLLHQEEGSDDEPDDDSDDLDNDDDDLGSEGGDDVLLAEKLVNQLGDKFDGEPVVQTDEHSEMLSDGGHGGMGRGYFSESSLQNKSSKKKVKTLEKTASMTLHNQNINQMSSNWAKKRQELKELHENEKKISHPVDDTPKTIDKMSRQERFAADLGFNPTKPTVDETGHDKKTNLPFAEKKPIEVGLTEFPYGEKKENSTGVQSGKGYDIPMRDMDEKQVEEREYFNNMNKLPIQRMKREELADYIKDTKEDHNYGYSNEAPTEQEETKFALLNAMGLEKIAEGEESPIEGGPEVKPVQHKTLKTAPKEPGFVEPEVIPSAEGKVSEAITKFFNTSREIDEVKKALAEKIKPLQDSLKQISDPLNEDIASKTALLNSYMNMIFEQLLKTDKQISAYEKDVFAAYQKVKLTTPNVTLAQVIAKADQIDAKLSIEIKKIKALIENTNTKEVLEQTLYQYPVSKVQEKKVSMLRKQAEHLDRIIGEILEAIRTLESINSEIEELTNDL